MSLSTLLALSFIKFIKKKRDHKVWITLSRDSFEVLMGKKEEVMRGETVELDHCVVRRELIRGKVYILFLKENGMDRTRIHLKPSEWEKFLDLETEIRDRLSKPKDLDVNLEGMTVRYMVVNEGVRYFFFEEVDAQTFGHQRQLPCSIVTTMLPNPSDKEIVSQLFAYLIDTSMTSEAPKRLNDDDEGFMDWEGEDVFDSHYMRARLSVLYRARLDKVFGIELKEDETADKKRVQEILRNGQTLEYQALMKDVCGLEPYKKLLPVFDDVNFPGVIAHF